MENGLGLFTDQEVQQYKMLDKLGGDTNIVLAACIDPSECKIFDKTTTKLQNPVPLTYFL